MLAEQKAYEVHSRQKRWSLVTILPSVVQGPLPGMAPSGTCATCCSLNSGIPSLCIQPCITLGTCQGCQFALLTCVPFRLPRQHDGIVRLRYPKYCLS